MDSNRQTKRFMAIWAMCFFIALSVRPALSQLSDSSSWAVKAWLKAEDLAREGLRPGDPVSLWKDACWGIRFSPNPNPPQSDQPPTYAEYQIPGRPQPVPAVSFDGSASLRQLDVLDVVDQDITAFVVYWPLEEGVSDWKEMYAKRHGADCIYWGGIATALNPRLYYTAYRENGIRLGANPCLPLVLTAHQNEYDPRPRFQGYIAEVLVFARAWSPDDPYYLAVEKYLHDKYFAAPGSEAPAPAVPWYNPQAAAPAQPAKTIEKPAPKDKENQIALQEVSVFSLTNQQNPSQTEYAAGEVMLPFSYTAVVSDAPRPPCLDFPGQHNPDCCHAFIRIDGELWMFRIDWIVEKGRCARWRGPDIDHMVKMEDGIYPPETGLGWFLGGMWFDQSQRKLYSPLHVEQEGNDRTYPAGGWSSRKIALATSTDKGKTWKYEGDIITPETYFFNREYYKFSGAYYGNGVCDFGYFADLRNGYFYIFPEESWYIKGQWGALWGVRAARSAITDKMAPGTWSYFYDGNWDEPALGGRSTLVAPSHLWGIIYSEYLDKYLCIFPSNKDPWGGPYAHNVDGVMIGACSDLAKQDWVWGYCPEAMFGFMKLFNEAGTDVNTCGQTFRHYGYFADNTFRRVDFTLKKEPMKASNWMPRYSFEPHPESSDPIIGRKTKIVGSSSPEMKYSGSWAEINAPESYQGKVRESTTPGSSLAFSFPGPDIYWRAVRSPAGGKADVFIDNVLRKTVDCFSPRSTSHEVFVYLQTGLAPDVSHTIRIVVRDDKNPGSQGQAIGHIAFEYAAESYKASAGFCSLMGKNNWYYQQKKESTYSDLRFIPNDDIFTKDWLGEGNCRIGSNYQIPDPQAESIRKWLAPHGGVIRVEGTAALPAGASGETYARLLHNADEIWQAAPLTPQQPASHDLTVTVQQGDALCFLVGTKAAGGENNPVNWDPVITYTQSEPAVWKPNEPGSQNIALGKYARSKMLAYAYQPFNAVDGDPGTYFAIYADDKISASDDWLMVDLEKKYQIDRYVLISIPPVPAWRPETFTLQKSDDGFTWTDVDSVTANQIEKLERQTPPFTARYVRLYLPHGKPFSIAEFELYYDGTK